MDSQFINGIKAIRDESTGVVWGRLGNYYTYVISENKKKYLTVTMAVSQNGSLPHLSDFTALIGDGSRISDVQLSHFRVVFILNLKARSTQASQVAWKDLNRISNYLASYGYENCSEDSGMPSTTHVCNIHGHILLLRELVFRAYSVRANVDNTPKRQKTDNALGGTVGALLGSFAGILAIVGLGQLNLVAVISGVIMGFCSVWGYQKLGGGLTKRGIIITTIVCIIMTYVGERMDWSVTIAREVGGSFLDWYRIIPQLVRKGYIKASTYYLDMGLTYLFTMGGLAGQIAAEMRNVEIRNEVAMLPEK